MLSRLYRTTLVVGGYIGGSHLVHGDEPLHQIHSYTLLFLLFLHFLYIADPPLCTSAPMRPHAIALVLAWQLHLLYQTDLAYLMDIWLTIHMYLLLFLVSPMCPLLRSDQSWVLVPRGQALSIALPYACIFVYHSYLTCLYLPFATEHHYRSPNQLPIHTSLPQNWDLALTLCTVSHLFCTISHCIALPRSHHFYLPQYTWRQSLTPRSHPLRAP